MEPIFIISSAGSRRQWVDLEKYEADLKTLRDKGLRTLRKPENEE